MLNGQLLNYHNEITNWMKTGSVVLHLMESKIKNFYSEYSVRIASLNDKIIAMQKKYFVHDDAGIPVTEKVDGKDVVVCIEGMVQEDFNKEYIALMNMEVGAVSMAVVE